MKKRGISLIVLVITIIVIVILGTAVVVTFVKNNPIENAKNATNKWNKKTLEEKANMLESELLLEFQESGLGSMVLPSYAKEVYMDALKEGKTEEEAKQMAMDSFIGNFEDWECDGKHFLAVLQNGDAIYDPIYPEVKRVTNLLWTDLDTAKGDLNINTEILPEDLVQCLLQEQENVIAYYESGETEEAEEIYTQAWEENEPLSGFIDLDPENKYYELTKALPLRLPRYVYNFNKTKIFDVTQCEYINYSFGGAPGVWNKIPQLIIDETYTVLPNGIIPPVAGSCEIVLPNTLKRIEKFAFRSVMLKKISKLVIPSSVEVIEEGAFGTFTGVNIQEIVIKKEKGSIPGEPWGLNTTKTTIKWEP